MYKLCNYNSLCKKWREIIKCKLIILSVILSGTVIAQDNDRLFSPEELRADVNYYYEMLYTKHPNPYHYYALSEFEDVKNRAYAQLKEPLTKEQFGLIITELNSCMDRHSQIHSKFSYLNQTDIEQEFRSNVFPLIEIRNGSVFFAYDHKQDEIVEINGIAVSDILSDIEKGYNWRLPYADAVNFNQMEMNFTAEIHFTYKLKSPFQIKFANDNKIYSVEGFNKAKIREQANVGRQRYGIDNRYPYQIYPDNSIAIFYITTFDGSEKERFEKACNEFIRTVNEQKIKYIFYDVSNNGGGSYQGTSAFDIVRHDEIYFRFTKIRREKAQVVRKYKINDLLLPPNHDINIPEGRKLFVLQGISTESGGDYFCRIVSENKLGVLVGQPTGELTTAFTSNRTYTMPKTQIRFHVAEDLWDFSDYFDSETLNPDMYWDVNHSRDFTEKELMEIINQWKKQ